MIGPPDPAKIAALEHAKRDQAQRIRMRETGRQGIAENQDALRILADHEHPHMTHTLPPRTTTPTTADLYPRTLVVWSDDRLYQLQEVYTYEWSKDLVRYRLTVPQDTLTDLASVPQPLWWWIAPRNLREASILHDDGYKCGGNFGARWERWDGRQWVAVDGVWTRREVDRLFGRVMRERNVPRVKRRAAFLAVRLFGWRAWKERQ